MCTVNTSSLGVHVAATITSTSISTISIQLMTSREMLRMFHGMFEYLFVAAP